MTAIDSKHRALFQFRSGLLERRIAKYSGLWNLPANETVKRLTALAASCLDVEQYPRLVTLAEVICGRSSKLNFVKACHEVRIALDAANLTREQIGMKPLEGEERARFIETMAEEMESKQRHSLADTTP